MYNTHRQKYCAQKIIRISLISIYKGYCGRVEGNEQNIKYSN